MKSALLSPLSTPIKAHQIVWERRNLLESRDCNIPRLSSLTLFEESIVYLSSAQDVSANLIGCDELFGMWLGDVSQEVRLPCHLVKVRTCLWMTEERLGEEQDKRFAEFTMDLSTEDMEVVGRCAVMDEYDH